MSEDQKIERLRMTIGGLALHPVRCRLAVKRIAEENAAVLGLVGRGAGLHDHTGFLADPERIALNREV